jgi:hypothetical protein
MGSSSFTTIVTGRLRFGDGGLLTGRFNDTLVTGAEGCGSGGRGTLLARRLETLVFVEGVEGRGGGTGEAFVGR